MDWSKAPEKRDFRLMESTLYIFKDISLRINTGYWKSVITSNANDYGIKNHNVY